MLNKLSLIVVMILSLSLAFYCVDFHKSNILSIVNTDEKNLMKQNSTPAESIEKIYVESLAVENKDKTDEIEPKITEKLEIAPIIAKLKKIIAKIKPQEKTEPKEEFKAEDKKSVKSATVSEYSESYKLDELEKMVEEELKKGNKD